MPVFELGEASGLKQIASDKVVRCYFGNFIVPFGITKMIVVYEGGGFYVMLNKTFQENLLISVHVVGRVNHKSIRNEWFHKYFK